MNCGFQVHRAARIALGVLGRLEVLKSLFDLVQVPEAVQKEVERGGIKLAGLEDFRRADWMRIVPLQKPSDALLESLRDVGEAAVITPGEFTSGRLSIARTGSTCYVSEV